MKTNPKIMYFGFFFYFNDQKKSYNPNFIIGENCIVIVKGANDKLSFKHVQQSLEVIKNAKVVMFQLEINLDVTLKSLKLCKENGCKCYISIIF